MSMKKVPVKGPQKADGKKKRTWPRRVLLGALLLAAGVLAWTRLMPLEAPQPSSTPTPFVSASPAPTARDERSVRETAYENDMAALQALLGDERTDETVRAQAGEKLAEMVADHQSELGLEEALGKAGFGACYVLAQNGALTVLVPEGALGVERSAAILSLCAAHTDVDVENIRIMSAQ